MGLISGAEGPPVRARLELGMGPTRERGVGAALGGVPEVRKVQQGVSGPFVGENILQKQRGLPSLHLGAAAPSVSGHPRDSLRARRGHRRRRRFLSAPTTRFPSHPLTPQPPPPPALGPSAEPFPSRWAGEGAARGVGSPPRGSRDSWWGARVGVVAAARAGVGCSSGPGRAGRAALQPGCVLSCFDFFFSFCPSGLKCWGVGRAEPRESLGRDTCTGAAAAR